MMLSDKLGELHSAFGWRIDKTSNDEFEITVWTLPQIGPSLPHEMKTKAHKNIHNAVDEAIELFKEHLADCSLC